MLMAEQTLLRTVRFADLTKWSPNVSVFDQMQTNDPLVPLTKLLTRAKVPVDVEDDQLYKRITVRLYGQGVLQRDQIYGKSIGTKKQFIAHTGQLIISRIDARNGAFGIVPEELDGGIVTNDFWLFDVQNVLPQYLILVLSSELFQRHWQAQSSGTTNRQRVSENDFLYSKIALPSLEKQQSLLDKYNNVSEQACKSEYDAAALEQEVDRYLYDALGIHRRNAPENKTLLTLAAFKDISQWGYDKIALPFPFAFKKYQAYSFYTKPSWLREIYRGKSPKYCSAGTSIILNQKCNRMDYIDLTYAKNVESAWVNGIDPKYFTQKGDILLNSTGEGTLGRASLVTDKCSHLLYDSHMLLLRVNEHEVVPQLLVDLINSSFGQKQVEICKSAQATKQTELGIKNAKKILFPLPELSLQNEISAVVQEKKQQIRVLRSNAEKLRQYAKKEFEKAVFGSI